MPRLPLIALAAAAFVFPGVVLAGGCQDGQDDHAVVRHIFETADTDADGGLTPSEYAAAGLQNYGVSFEESDANSDGKTTLSEYLALYDRHHSPDDRVNL